MSSSTGSGRLVAVDAFRGAVMLLMASSGFGFAQVSASFPGSHLWHWVGQYCLWQLTGGFFRDTLRTHLGQGIFAIPSPTFAPIWERLAVLTCFWLILFWMHRRRIFLKL